MKTADEPAAEQKMIAIVQAVGDYYRIPLTVIQSTNRRRPVAWARHVAMFLCREFTGAGANRIGRVFSRTHSCVQQAWKTVADLQAIYPELHLDVEAVRKRLSNGNVI